MDLYAYESLSFTMENCSAKYYNFWVFEVSNTLFLENSLCIKECPCTETWTLVENDWKIQGRSRKFYILTLDRGTVIGYFSLCKTKKQSEKNIINWALQSKFRKILSNFVIIQYCNQVNPFELGSWIFWIKSKKINILL